MRLKRTASSEAIINNRLPKSKDFHPTTPRERMSKYNHVAITTGRVSGIDFPVGKHSAPARIRRCISSIRTLRKVKRRPTVTKPSSTKCYASLALAFVRIYAVHKKLGFVFANTGNAADAKAQQAQDPTKTSNEPPEARVWIYWQ
jgi:hypothetical protein